MDWAGGLLLELVRYLSPLVYGGVAAVAWGLHRRVRRPASRWPAVAFTALAAAVTVSLLVSSPEALGEPWGRVHMALVAGLVIGFPAALVGFVAALGAVRQSVAYAAAAALGVLLVWALALPPEPTTAPDPWQPWIWAVGAYWTVLSVTVAVLLWRAGRGRPGTARKRMRLMAVATAVLNVALLLAAAGATDPGVSTGVVPSLLGWVSAGAFVLGFAPPAILRRSWRRAEEAELARAQAELVAAVSREEALEGLLPRVRRLLGAHGAALVDRTGVVVGADGAVERATAVGLDEETVEVDRVVVPLQHGALVVEAHRLTPFFGSEEVALLRNLGTYLDLALDRLALMALEREATLSVARTNEELKSLLYGISHDLRNPIVTVLGYVNVLQADFAEELPPQALHYLERISASSSYMDALICDLLELSRVGRTQVEREPVDLTRLAETIAEELTLHHPRARVDVRPLPTVRMNPERARQLLTNLLFNAAAHGGREDITVTLDSARTPQGDVLVRCADDGAGIPEAYRERVFAIFERLDASGGRGTGVGLTMCRRIVEELGGEIAIGEAAAGTTFELRLPAGVLAERRGVPA